MINVLTSAGTICVIASAPMTSDQWARAAVELAVDTGASEIAVESFAARETYLRVVRDAMARYQIGRPIRVTAWPPKGSGRGGGDAIARSSGLLQALEVGTCRLASHFPALEEQAVTWQQGQHQPDALAALVVAFDVLVHSASQHWSFAVPVGSITDRATATSLTGYLSRRLDGLGGGGRSALAGDPALARRLNRR